MSRRLLGVAVVLGMAAGLTVFGVNGLVRVSQMRHEIEGLEHDLVTLHARVDQLTVTIDRLRNDPTYVEKLAREDLGMVRQGDTILKFPSERR